MYVSTSNADSFEMWVATYPPDEEQRAWTLSEYISKWLQSGVAPEAFFSSYQIYIQSIIFIIDEWVKRPDILNYRHRDVIVQRRAATVMGKLRDARNQASELLWLDPEFFAYHNYLASLPKEKRWGVDH